jgi:8-oxo-dGTP diphosphatase
MKTIRVVAAIIHKDGKIFATQRGYGAYKDYWEFPGGKIEPGETPEQALIREIREELATTIQVERFLTTVEYDYPEFHLSMDCFLCSIVGVAPKLLEHESARWLTMDHLYDVNWLPADLIVIGQLRIHETNEIRRNHYGRFGTDEAGKDLYRQNGKWD